MSDLARGVILALNAGSSSVKFAIFESEALERLAGGEIERIGSDEASLHVTSAIAPGADQRTPAEVPDAPAAIGLLISSLPEILAGREIAAIAYRVVHGGERFVDHTRVSDSLLEELRKIISLSPEHLPAAIELMGAFREAYPGAEHTACFDTAFHADLPAVAKTLPLPRRYQEMGMRRFGFHGLSYTYLLAELERIGAPGESAGRVILAHLGNGSSLAALRAGKCVDTSMAFSPASGVPMGSRTGDIDPGALCHLIEQEGLDADQLRHLVFKESGLLGISGTSADVRDLLAIEGDDPRAAEALDHYCYQVRKWIGAFAAALGGLDTLVFSGGIGANSATIRERICSGLGFLGLPPESDRVAVHVIPTDEEIVLARIAHNQRSGVARN